MFKAILHSLSMGPPAESPAKRIVQTVYNVMKDAHMAVITAFVPSIKITIRLANHNQKNWTEDVHLVIRDQANRKIEIRSYTVQEHNSSLSFHLHNCQSESHYCLELSLKQPLPAFGTFRFEVAYETA